MLKHPKFITKTSLLLLLGIFTVSLVFLIFQYKTQISEVLYLSTRRVPENITALYFSEPYNIPTYVTSGEIFEISFVIENLTTTTKEYDYIVYSAVDGVQTMISEDSVKVDPDDKKTISLEASVDNSTRQKVVVEIPEIDQFISFWIN